MPYGKQRNKQADDTKEFFCIEQTAMMDDILQTDQSDEQNGKGSAPAEKIAKEICKKEADKADIQPKNTDP